MSIGELFGMLLIVSMFILTCCGISVAVDIVKFKKKMVDMLDKSQKKMVDMLDKALDDSKSGEGKDS